MMETIRNGTFCRNNTLPPPPDRTNMSLFSLTGKTAIISRAGGGIGFAVTKAFAEASAAASTYATGADFIVDSGYTAP